MGQESIGCLEGGFGIGEKLFTGRGDNDLAGGTLDELKALSLFEGDETLGERGLGDFELGGCGSEVLIFRNGDESAQLSKCRAILFIMHAYHSNTHL